MGSEQWAGSSGQWADSSGQWAVGGGRWADSSGQWKVNGEQGAAASKRISHGVRDEEERRAAEAAKRKGPTLFDLEDVT